jgi:putative endonuclease
METILRDVSNPDAGSWAAGDFNHSTSSWALSDESPEDGFSAVVRFGGLPRDIRSSSNNSITLLFSRKAGRATRLSEMLDVLRHGEVTKIPRALCGTILPVIPPPAYEPEASPSSKKAYVYLLRSNRDGRFYVGWTTDVERRLQQHNEGKSRYTKSRGPWELVATEVFEDKDLAKKRERTLKHNPRMLFLFKKRAISDAGPLGRRQVVG